ncbi:MAG: response regulator transcription factor [Deltaproteobacteria bacterium]|nr:response regulator transcription factor [Deltaproteobacteria bacterium]
MHSTISKGQDFETLFFEAQRVIDICSLDEFRKEALNYLGRSLDAKRGSFLIMEGLHSKIYKYRAIGLGIDEKFINLYRRYYHYIDPFQNKKKTHNLNVFTTEDVTTFQSLLKTEYYNDFLKPQSIYHQLTIKLHGNKQLLGAVSLCRPKEEKKFSEQEKIKAQYLAPFISVSLMKNLAVNRMHVYDNIINATVSEHPNQGIIVLDENLTTVYYNEKAVSLLENAEINICDPGKPLAAFPNKLQMMCKYYMDCDPSNDKDKFSSPMFRIDGGAKCKLTVCIRKFNNLHQQYLMLCIEPEESIRTLNQTLYDIGLTPREVELSNLLVKGLKNDEISEKLCISKYTVQNHLKSIFKKMRVKNRSSLIYRFIQLTSSDSVYKN